MKNTLIRRLIYILSIIIAVVCFALVYKELFGTRIEHFAQYIYPCQGQILSQPNQNTTISFHVLDEKDISEMSEKGNINSIVLMDQDREEWEATDWHIGSSGFYTGNTYSAKKLDVIASFPQKVTIQYLKINYPDKSEIFFIGELTIRPIQLGALAAYTQISTDIFSFDNKNYMVNEDATYFNKTLSMLRIDALSFHEGYTIQQIDLGIQGLGIDPSTVSFVPNNTDYGTSFENDPKNNVYFVANTMNTLPDQECNIDIISRDASSIHIALRQDKSYESTPTSLYIAPLYTCIDKASGEQYIYGELNLYYIKSPHIVSDDYAESLLKEFGK